MAVRTRTWSNGWPTRVIAILVGVGISGVFVAGSIVDAGGYLESGIVASASVVAVYVGYFRPRLTVDEDGLTVRNPLSSTRVVWDEYVGSAPGYGGLRIELRSSEEKPRVVAAWAVQQWNASTWLGRRRTRSWRVVSTIEGMRPDSPPGA